jgi:streptogramin lyase
MSLRKLYPFILAVTVAGLAMAGTLSVQIKEYEVPTPRSRPHDPALAPDGSLWYTGQGANKLGRLDPKTGEFKEFPLKTPNSGPHGLVADKEGNIWFTAISGGYVGKLDPKTSAITEYHAPQGADIDPHTPVFDHNGILWFTNEETNYIGRLDPSTGKMTLAKSPTAHAVPYGIVVAKDNVDHAADSSSELTSIETALIVVYRYSDLRSCQSANSTLYLRRHFRFCFHLRTTNSTVTESCAVLKNKQTVALGSVQEPSTVQFRHSSKKA